jgi:hypothetical protein
MFAQFAAAKRWQVHRLDAATAMPAAHAVIQAFNSSSSNGSVSSATSSATSSDAPVLFLLSPRAKGLSSVVLQPQDSAVLYDVRHDCDADVDMTWQVRTSNYCH